MSKYSLDAIDRQIIAELQADARLSNVDLADKVGLSPSPCLRRVKRLEREGYIEGYRAALRRERVGLGFSVFIGVKIDGHANQLALKFEEAINAMPEVIACHLVSGEADYLLEVVVPDLEHAVEGHRWAIEDSFETAKNEFGLDHNESRSWHGWHRHVSMVMLAFAMMAAIRHHANPPQPKKTQRRPMAKTKPTPPRH